MPSSQEVQVFYIYSINITVCDRVSWSLNISINSRMELMVTTLNDISLYSQQLVLEGELWDDVTVKLQKNSIVCRWVYNE